VVDLEEDHRETVVEVGVGVLDLPLLLIVGMQRAMMERNLKMYQVYLLYYQL
jgi:hypothetical protein